MVNVTFNIDLSGEVFDKVFIAGYFSFWGMVEMTQSSNSIYSYTVQLEENKTHEYKFLIIRPGELEKWEILESRASTNYNRTVDVGDVDMNLPASFFSICD